MQPTNSQQVGYNPEFGPDQRAETGAEKGLYADVWDAADMDKMPEIDYNGNQVVANNEARAAAASDPNAELPPLLCKMPPSIKWAEKPHRPRKIYPNCRPHRANLSPKHQIVRAS